MTSVALRYIRLCDVPLYRMSTADQAKFDEYLGMLIQMTYKSGHSIYFRLECEEFRLLLTPLELEALDLRYIGVPDSRIAELLTTTEEDIAERMRSVRRKALACGFENLRRRHSQVRRTGLQSSEMDSESLADLSSSLLLDCDWCRDCDERKLVERLNNPERVLKNSDEYEPSDDDVIDPPDEPPQWCTVPPYAI